MGKTGDTVKVKPGFARNFLIPEGIALRASSKNLSIFKEQKKFEKVRQKREKSFNENIAKRLSNVEITMLQPHTARHMTSQFIAYIPEG